MNLDADFSLLQLIADDLAERGWSVQDAFLPASLIAALAAECRTRASEGLLAAAAVGRGDGQAVREGIRGDRIHWLEPGQSEACDHYLSALDTLRLTLNRTLFLGLEDFEGHFALYPPGSFYQKHLDRFRDDDRRTVTAVFYLNADWREEQGGALRMYLPDEQVLDLAPLAGRLAVFLSGDFPHEVLPASHERLSLTGWFRRRGSF
ncbi:2OG-Fe(II) oxygenase [Pseudomonas sp. ZM23]|uniref:2OG-Fe(II) oxygenase n=1 Tax=Pseudomonas triclosanedens TaxID=2961893 RepID=A0ABY6ZWP5_9PSED|nr:2OG-Fe(II) oxygenase [Pseudomonas triclosanedens]MCP8466832.1 2OG-Fe(II) oxygenase [Pseudomonas triclosanedens]MCP8470056.1 2OG-Fe(II) oxygenase [Pseudomonas triclosanedens]MCP8477966.1 2OG-Fe(II) oxygenase [Pseudomonas triclosanedens]WAI49382.1 2OG-Fe(II) oxygenase [Pseudomonas triclosanedens]